MSALTVPLLIKKLAGCLKSPWMFLGATSPPHEIYPLSVNQMINISVFSIVCVPSAFLPMTYCMQARLSQATQRCSTAWFMTRRSHYFLEFAISPWRFNHFSHSVPNLMLLACTLEASWEKWVLAVDMFHCHISEVCMNVVWFSYKFRSLSDAGFWFVI